MILSMQLSEVIRKKSNSTWTKVFIYKEEYLTKALGLLPHLHQLQFPSHVTFTVYLATFLIEPVSHRDVVYKVFVIVPCLHILD